MIQGKLIKNTKEFEHCGIYAIVNLYNNKFYIGSSKNLKQRKRQHFDCLKSNTHVNKYLQHSYNKYGDKYFIMIEIEKVIDENNLIQREQWWLDNTNATDNSIAYNICPNANTLRGYNHSFETKQKISEKLSAKTVYQYDLDGKLVKIWNSLNDISSEFGLKSRSSLIMCCNEHYNEGRYKTFRGYVWSYIELSDFEVISIIAPKHKKGYSKDKENMKRIKVKKIDIENNTEEIDFLMNFHDKGFNKANICACCRGRRKTYKGYKWKYLEDIKIPLLSNYNETQIIKLYLNGEFAEEGDITDFASRGYCKYLINCCCQGKRKTHKGFKWQYKNSHL